MEIRVLIVDDSPPAIELLKKHLASFPYVKVVHEASGGKEAMDYLREHAVDLIFLDIEMEEIDGIRLAEHIQKLYPDVLIVFATGHSGFALESYACHPVDFLMKPIDYFRLEKTMHIVKKRFAGKENRQVPDFKIGIKSAGGIQIIQVQDVLYVEKKGRKLWIVDRKEGDIQANDTMKNIEDMFVPFGFYRCHQSFIVSLHKIKAIYPDTLSRSHTIALVDGTELPLSRNKLNELKHYLEHQGILIH